MSRYGFLSFAVMSLCFVSIHGLSPEEDSSIREAFIPFMKQCSEEFGVTKEQYYEAKKKESADNIDPCFISCFLKKSEVFDSTGKLDAEKMASFNKANVKNEGGVKFLDKVGEKCIKVNDQEVNDGDKGCERAKLLFDCIVELKKNGGD